MESHNDRPDHEGLSEVEMKMLKERAAKMIANKESEIANTGEPIEERKVGDLLVRHLPVDDVCNRVSIGSGRKLGRLGYISFRGDPHEVEALLKRAWKTMKVFNGEKP